MHPQFIPRRIMDDDVCAGHAGAHGLAVGDIARRALRADLDQGAGLWAVGPAHERDDVPAARNERPGQWLPDKTCAACEKDFHRLASHVTKPPGPI